MIHVRLPPFSAKHRFFICRLFHWTEDCYKVINHWCRHSWSVNRSWCNPHLVLNQCKLTRNSVWFTWCVPPGMTVCLTNLHYLATVVAWWDENKHLSPCSTENILRWTFARHAKTTRLYGGTKHKITHPPTQNWLSLEGLLIHSYTLQKPKNAF